jgi:hypothetical protein
MEPSKSVFDDRCFLDFFPKQNKKYQPIYQDLRNIDDYDWNSYLNLSEVGGNKKRDFCKRKCFNQKFSPNKFNRNTKLFPSKQELLEFVKLMDMDPSEDKHNCIWTIENREELSNLDVSDVGKNIKMFEENFPGKGLPETYEELIFDVKKANYVFEGKYEDDDTIKVLYEGKYGKLIIPLTIESSCKYGKGTKWCTAATEADNYFEEYTRFGPLYIWTNKSDGKKYQFFFHDLEFKDMLNQKIPRETIQYFRKKHPILSQLWKDEENVILRDILSDNEPLVYPLLTYYILDIDMDWPEFEKLLEMNPDILENYFIGGIQNYLQEQYEPIEKIYRSATWDDNIPEESEITLLKNFLTFTEGVKKLEKKFNFKLDKEETDKIEKSISRARKVISMFED